MRLHRNDATTLHVRRIVQHGDPTSWLWTVERLSPFLELQAEYRLRGRLRRLYDPSDLLNDVWLRAYPQVAEMDVGEERVTPRLVRLLSVILIRRVNELLRKEVRRGRSVSLDREVSGDPAARAGSGDPGSVGRHLVRAETADRVRATLSALDPLDAEAIVLRGIEQMPNQVAAASLGVRPGTLAMRYRRALERLRSRLPDELHDDVFG